MNGSATSDMVMAVTTRVLAPRRSSASCSASALITVASMPMLSPATRSIPSVAAVTPRKMFPPPMTMTICTPALCTATISSAIPARVSASMPVRRPPISASPESFRRMRLYFGFEPSVIRAEFISPSLDVRHHFRGEVVRLLLDPLAELVAHETRYGECAARFLAGALPVVGDALLVVADVRLLEQAGLAVELLQLSGDHLLDDVGRLARLLRLIARDLALGVEVLLRDVGAGDEARLGGGDVHGDVARGGGGTIAA